MGDAVLIERFSERELREMLMGIVQDENEQLRIEIALLREELRHKRAVITPQQATFYFDSKVTSATVIDYIWHQGLPAFKNGRLWFIYRFDLLDWQIGLIGHPSTKRLGIKNVISPRHYHRSGVGSYPERDRSGQRRGQGPPTTITSKSRALRNRHLSRHRDEKETHYLPVNK